MYHNFMIEINYEPLLKFSGKWRDYQKRILDSLEKHLSDEKLHIVAAPGAGKTTLGIEVISKINKSTLILAPTITIRNQWKQRIIDAFLNGNSEDIISTNIKEPSFITIITYQALLAAFCGIEEKEETPLNEEFSDEENTEEISNEKIIKRFNKEKADLIINILKQNNLKLCCFDEAHHLRNEWWKALDYLMDEIKPEQTISLTATPPYDADPKEWERYENLCGPIDEVISIPELVKNGDLCPHQDFIHFSLLRKEEREIIDQQIIKVNKYINEILNDENFKHIVETSSYMLSEEEILDNPTLSVAILSYQKNANVSCNKDILETLSFKEKQIPKFTTEFQKELLKFIFFNLKEKLHTQNDIELVEQYLNKAKHAGIISNKSIILDDNPKIKKQMANSLGKLDSIKKIVDLETKVMKNGLRMVILADYIKADNLDCSALGVIPIWQTLKDRDGISLAVLTGSIILLPYHLKDELEDILNKNKLEEIVSISVFERDSNYIKITPKGVKKSLIVDIITQMFNQGHITVIVGTQALLGEGWDAPCINSLILSSTVSSYMLSNQMRGRAIRIDKNSPDKISNIWHLATVSIMSIPEKIKEAFNYTSINNNYSSMLQIYDYNQLEQRFQGFQAPSFFEPHYIENGIERILPKKFINLYKNLSNILTEKDFLEINNIMESLSINRAKTKFMWEEGLYDKYNNVEKSLRTGIETEKQFKTINYNGDIYAILFRHTLALAFTLFSFACFGLFSIFYIIPVLAVYLISLIKPVKKFINCSSPAKILRQICIVTMKTLEAMGKIKTNTAQVNIKCDQDPFDKTIFISASNLTPEENNLLIKCIQEILDPIENPKYLLVRKTKLGKKTATDYHAIPTVIGQNQKTVKIFKNIWEEHISECQIIYTRSISGRKVLLNARELAYSGQFRSKKSKKMSRFQ